MYTILSNKRAEGIGHLPLPLNPGVVPTTLIADEKTVQSKQVVRWKGQRTHKEKGDCIKQNKNKNKRIPVQSKQVVRWKGQRTHNEDAQTSFPDSLYQAPAKQRYTVSQTVTSFQ